MVKRIPGGFYMVLEGPEGSGKTTQCGLLTERLSEDFYVLRTREPGGTRFGDNIRTILLDPKQEKLSPLTEVLLFSAVRSHNMSNIVIPALRNGKIVLTDRNYYSTEAYQGAGGGIEVESIRSCANLATSGVRPNLAIILDIDSEIGLRRAMGVSEMKDKIEARSLEYHQRVRAAYLDIAKRDSDICVVVDGSKKVDEICDEVYDIAKERIDRVLKGA